MSQLPVAARGEEIAAAIARHQVIVLCGETGSGKTTQVPQICLRAGRGTNGLIGHTQPRRLAARSVAVRIAEETGTAPGTLVGYKVRFSDETGPDCRVKLMTDGILLQELRRDRDLRRYDTLIIDEAHERSVNIDFLLGYLKTLLPRRPDLRVVIMSATIDPQKFSAHFDDAPVIEVSGRTYPVEIRYQPGDEDSDSSEDIVRAVAALIDDKLDGDILVFLPGERDIRDAATMLRRHFNQQLDILPLYARLAAHEQDRVFSPGKKRRVVLATNVAETSITVPRIAAVIDTGLARINRYSHQSKIQRLPIEPISQASANQRAGRCGRVRDGTCIRLYSEDSFEQRDAYTDPEILRINLAQVLLRMADLRLGDIEAFPFPDPPDPRYVRDGLRLLGELRAIDDDERLTASGRKLARLAVDPRFGTMLINASRYGALSEMLIIAAALSIPDPADRREVEDPDPADDWRHPRSELIAYLQLWDLFHRRQKELNGSQLRKWCRRNGLAFMRLREWQDIHRQLRQQSHELRLRFNKQPAKYRQVHLAALSGLLSQVGHHREGVEYDGARGLRFRLVPGARQSPPWIVAATIQQTHRAYASQLAAVQPAWIERAATHLVRRRYSEPYWEAKKQRVYAGETVSLYGLTLRADRPVDFTGIDPRASMLVFTREGLARGLYRGDGAYRAHNDGIAAELRERSARLRRTDLLPDVQRQAAFFRARLPANCASPSVFEQWRAKAEKKDPEILCMRYHDATAAADIDYDPGLFPDALQLGTNVFRLQYRFAPAADDDGVTVEIPLAAIGTVEQARLDWLIPGLLSEKVIVLLRGLPKAVRRRLVPVPERAAKFVATADVAKPFYPQLAHYLTRASGEAVTVEQLQDVQLPDYLQLRIAVTDADDKTLAAGRSLDAVRRALGAEVRAAMAPVRNDKWHRSGLRQWDFDALPRVVEIERGGLTIEAAPGLVDQGDAVQLKLFETVDQARQSTRRGVARLIALRLPQQVGLIADHFNANNLRMPLLARHAGGVAQLADEVVMTVILDAMGNAVPVDRSSFERLANDLRADLVPQAERLAKTVTRVLEARHETASRLESVPQPAQEDIASQLEHLVYPGFVSLAGTEWLRHHPRFLQAIGRRLDAIAQGKSQRDQQLQRDVQPYWQRWLVLEADHGIDALREPSARRYRFMVEEYRVSLFAQTLRTSARVSPRRLDQLYEAIDFS